MTFIGIISNKKSFDILNQNLSVKKVKLIHINKNSIENIKNIIFETIIINKELKHFEEKIKIIEKLCNKAKYLIINTDIKLDLKLDINSKINLITYGLNQKATVTISSINENRVIIDLQRNIKNRYGQMIEVTEKQVNIGDFRGTKTYEILILFIIESLYKGQIMSKIVENYNFF